MTKFNIEKYLDSLPENTTEIDISDKLLTYIPNSILRFKHLQKLYCFNNELTSLPDLSILTKLETLYCYNNELTSLPELSGLINLQRLYCYNNELPEILNFKTYSLTHEEKNIIDRFIKCKYRIMCLKYKQHFRRWLWEHVRLPKINMEYHPDKLHDAVNLLGDNEEKDLFDYVGW